jgi:hypothetical protein
MEEKRMTTYKEAAANGYALLAQRYKADVSTFEGNIWFAGNTLHACLNYLLAANETTDSQGILPAGCKIYASLVHSSDRKQGLAPVDLSGMVITGIRQDKLIIGEA